MRQVIFSEPTSRTEMTQDRRSERDFNRGKDVRSDDGSSRVMEMIEDVPTLGPITSHVRLPKTPRRVYDALSGSDVPFAPNGDGTIAVTIPSLRIHTALVFEDS